MLTAFLSTRLGKLALGVLALIVALTLFALWLRNERQEAVEADRAKARSEVLERQIGAERAGNRILDAVQASSAAEAAKTHQAMKDAEDAEPEKARAAAGPVANAAAARLRERARRDGATTAGKN